MKPVKAKIAHKHTDVHNHDPVDWVSRNNKHFDDSDSMDDDPPQESQLG